MSLVNKLVMHVCFFLLCSFRFSSTMMDCASVIIFASHSFPHCAAFSLMPSICLIYSGVGSSLQGRSGCLSGWYSSGTHSSSSVLSWCRGWPGVTSCGWTSWLLSKLMKSANGISIKSHSCLGEVTGNGRCLGEISGTGSCLEGVPGTGEGLEDDPIGIDVSTVGHVTSSEAMVDVWFVQKSVSFYTNWMMRSKGEVSSVNCFHMKGLSYKGCQKNANYSFDIKGLLCEKVSKRNKLL